MNVSSQVDGPSKPRRIASVVAETGIAREVVHHYLRVGVLPPSDTRGAYTEHQVRLLRQVRRLREDHNLPLETIRQLFDVFEFDPAPIEALTLSESLCKRVTEFVDEGKLFSPYTLSADELQRETQVDPARFDEYLASRLVVPLDADGASFSAYDRNIVELCERGEELGISLDAFRTIASFVRIGFALEKAEFFRLVQDEPADAGRTLPNLFVRNEIAVAVVQNVLGSALHAHLHRGVAHAGRNGLLLADLAYRPSDAFVARHGLDAEIDTAREALGDAPDRRDRWQRAADLLLHAGRDREALFLLSEALERFPGEASLSQSHARAALLVGEGDTVSATADAGVLGAITALLRARHEGPSAVMRAAPALRERADAVLAVERDDGDPNEDELLAAWLITALPEGLADHSRGRMVLAAAVARLAGDHNGSAAHGHDEPPNGSTALPGYHDRLRITAAYLLLDAQRRGPARIAGEADPESLRTTICRLDPGSHFAAKAFLDGE